MIKIDKKTLEAAVKLSQTKREVLLNLQRSDSSSSYNLLRRLIKRYNVDDSHLLNRSAMTKKLYTDGKLFKRDNADMFCEHSKIARNVVKKRILRDNLIHYTCGLCSQQPIWNGKELTLILDHINGTRDDHRLENLRFVCPNCEAQLPTHCRGNYDISRRCKNRTRAEYQADKSKRYVFKQQKYIPLVLLSGIDFTKFGWTSKVAVIIEQPVQKVNKWMKRFMPDIYNSQCFKRKNAPMV